MDSTQTQTQTQTQTDLVGGSADNHKEKKEKEVGEACAEVSREHLVETMSLRGTHSLLSLQTVPNAASGPPRWILTRFLRPLPTQGAGDGEGTSKTKQRVLPPGVSPLLTHRGCISRGSYLDGPDGGVLLCREESGSVSVVVI